MPLTEFTTAPPADGLKTDDLNLAAAVHAALELRGWIRQLPGGLYVRISRRTK